MTFTVTYDWGMSSLGGQVLFWPLPSGAPVEAQILAGVLCAMDNTPGVPLPSQVSGLPQYYRANFSAFVGGQAAIIPTFAFAPLSGTVDLGAICPGIAPPRIIRGRYVSAPDPSTTDSLHIKDASDIGRSLITAVDQAAVQSIVGAGTGSEWEPFANLAAFPATGNAAREYLAQDTGKLYRWTGSAYSVLPVTWTDIGGKPAAIAAGGDAAAARAAVGAAKRVTYLIDDYGTVDYTGAAASDTAVAAAISAMGTAPGTLQFGAGTVRLDTTKTLAYPGQGLIGQGLGATVIDWRGTGDCLRVWDSTVNHDGLHSPGAAGPLTGFTIYGWNNGHTNACGLHVGDLSYLNIDVRIDGLPNTGCKGFWGENVYSYTERAYIRVIADNCKDNFVFENNASNAGSQPTWGAYSVLRLSGSSLPDCNGLTLKNNVAMTGVDLVFQGNFAPAATNTGVAVTIGTTGSDTSYIDGHVMLAAETTGTGVARHKDINVGVSAWLKGFGVLEFIGFSGAFVAGTASPTTVAFAGRISCPSLGTAATSESLRTVGSAFLTDPIVNRILDANGNLALGLQSNASAVNYLTIANRAAGNPPYIAAGGADANIPVMLNAKGTAGWMSYASAAVTQIPVVAAGDATNVGWDFQTQGTAGVTVNGSPTLSAAGVHAATSKTTPVDADELALVDSAASFGLKRLTWANLKVAIKSYYDTVASVMTNKTLTLPIVDAILDANGNYQLRFQSNASAANYLTVVNRAAGNPPYFAAAGSDTNIPVAFIPKGTSGFYTYSNNVGVTAIPFVVNGDATNVGLDVQTQGTERLRVNGVIVPTVSSTDTHTNKRITPRIGTVASGATPTINSDNVDQFNVTALAANITSMTTNLSGTPTDGQMLRIRIKDNGAARTVAWGAKFVAGPAALLTTTVISKTHFNEFVYDAAAALWVCTISHTAGY